MRLLPYGEQFRIKDHMQYHLEEDAWHMRTTSKNKAEKRKEAVAEIECV